MNIDDYQLYTLIVDGELWKKPHLQHIALKIAVFKSAVPPWFHPLVTFNFPPPTATDLLGLKVNHVIVGKCGKCLVFPMWSVAGFLCSHALAHIHAFGNRKAEEVVGGQPSFLLWPLTPAALLPTMYEVVSEGGLIVGSTTAAYFMKDGGH